MFLLSTDEHFSFYVCSSKLAPSILHYTCTHGNNVSVGLSVWLCVCSFLLTQSILCGGMLVDQCVSEALICLAAVLLWVGRWDGYPYPPSGQPGMDEMWPWPSAERDQGINVFRAIPAVQLFLQTCQIISVPIGPKLTCINICIPARDKPVLHSVYQNQEVRLCSSQLISS